METVGDINCDGNAYYSTTTSISAAGASQGTATAITADVNNVTTVAAGTGIILTTTQTGSYITILNSGANALLVYPPVGGTIDGQATNLPISVPVNQVWSGSAIATLTWETLVSPLYPTTNQTVVGYTAGAVTIGLAQPAKGIVATPAAINTTETILQNLLIGTAVAAGDTYIIQGYGTYTNTSGTARTSTFNVRVGTAGTTADTSIGTIGPITGSGSVTNIPFVFDIMVTFRTVGTSGTALINGKVSSNGATGISGATGTFVSGNTTASTINTTTNNYIDISFVTNNTSGSATFYNVAIYKVR